MNMNETPKGERVHIGIFGRRNAGKSSIINALTGQKTAIVSSVKGTTTDPVYKAMELLPIGPVMIIDTPGIDDEGELGEERVRASYRALEKCNAAVIVIDGEVGITKEDRELIAKIKEKNLPYVVAVNKCDDGKYTGEGIPCSAKNGENIDLLKNEIIKAIGTNGEERRLIADLLEEGDCVLLIVPIDSAAPKGRLILPQQQVIRDILDSNCTAVVTKEDKVRESVERFEPKIVVCDSQVFERVSLDMPEAVPLTSFSILFARYKGDLDINVEGAKTLDELEDGDRVLISEGCTHHRQCGDIGSVKIPGWIKKHTGKDLIYEFTAGGEFPEDLGGYKLVIHCGGCMLNEKEMKYRIGKCIETKTPIVNYGIAIAHMHGILKRSIKPFTKGD